MGDEDNEDLQRREPDEFATDPGPAWSGVGAARGPRPPAEGVRIIGAEEAAAAIESGEVAARQPDDAPRFGDVPKPPPGPRPEFRFPGDDPASVPKPPVAAPEPDPSMPGFTMGHMGGGFNEELVSGAGTGVGDNEHAAAATGPTARAGGEPPGEAAGTATGTAAGNAGDARSPEAEDGIGRASTFDDFLRRSERPAGRSSERKSTFSRLWETSSSDSLLGATRGRGAGDDALAPAADDPLARAADDPLARVGGRSWLEGADGAFGAPSPGGPPGVSARPSGPGSSAERGRSWLESSSTPGGSEGSFWDDSRFGWTGAGSPPPSGATMSGAGGGGTRDVRQSGDEALTADDSGSVPLPHWTEPPSGEVPRILPDAEPTGSGDRTNESDGLSAWSALSTAPRWRDQPTDWDEADFHEAVVDDEETRVGALRVQEEPAGDDLFSFDDITDPRTSRATRTARPPRPRRPAPPEPDAPPATYEAEAAARPEKQADLTTRVITGMAAAGVALIAMLLGRGTVLALATAAVVLAAAELFGGLRARGYQPATLLGLVGTASLMGGVYWKGQAALPLVLVLYTVFCLLWYLLGVVRARPTMNVAVSIMAFLYVGFLGSFAAVILKEGGFILGGAGDDGIGVLLGAIIATVAYDIGAFFVGRSFGRTPLAPSISPNKTFEGLVGASVVTVAASLFIVSQIHPWNAGRAFWLAVVVAVAAPLGDLCESMIKRDLDVKDMGTALPGHGGVLDRIDALLFVIPATYYLLWLF